MVRVARVGLPLAGTVLVKFAVLGVLAIAAARLGTQQAATHGVAEALVNLVFTVAVAIGQSVVPLVASAARDGDVRAGQRAVRAGVQVALCAVGVLGAVLLVGGRWIVPVFTDDPAVADRVERLLPLVVLVVVADALQAVWGFAMVGLRRTVPSLVSTAVFFGVLAVVAVPVADRHGLTGLWSALLVANVAQAVSKAVAFRVLCDRVDPVPAER